MFETESYLKKLEIIPKLVDKIREAIDNHEHTLILMPAGTGKTFAVRNAIAKLPPLQKKYEDEVRNIAERAGLLKIEPYNEYNDIRIPFRAPHHTVSEIGMVGLIFTEKEYRTFPYTWKPGELNLAHRGVLFLDEVNEFKRNVLQRVFEAMKNKRTILKHNYEFPADFTLIATMDTCPCGNFFETSKTKCICLPETIKKYYARTEFLMSYFKNIITFKNLEGDQQ